MNRKVYKWDLEDFIKCFDEMGLKSSYKRIEGRNAILVRVANFEEMKCLFGHGRSMWAIAMDRNYWNRYVKDVNRWQFVYLNFDVKKESKDGSAFAFTYDPTKRKFTDAASRRNVSTIGERIESIEYILPYVLDCPIEFITNMKLNTEI